MAPRDRLVVAGDAPSSLRLLLSDLLVDRGISDLGGAWFAHTTKQTMGFLIPMWIACTAIPVCALAQEREGLRATVPFSVRVAGAAALAWCLPPRAKASRGFGLGAAKSVRKYRNTTAFFL